MNVTDLPDVTALYESTFPAGERKPTDWIATALGRADYRWLVAETNTGGTPVRRVSGFAAVFDAERFCLIEYLAVDPKARGGGIGSALVRASMRASTIVEVEIGGPCAERRRVFYQRLGFRRLMELPYTCPLPNAPPMELLAAGPVGDLAEWVRLIYRCVYDVPR